MVSVSRIRMNRNSNVRQTDTDSAWHSHCFWKILNRSGWVVFPIRSIRIPDTRLVNQNGKAAIQNQHCIPGNDNGISA
jgi:hypothetical protein